MDITPEIVRDLLDYDPGTGVFVWRLRGRQWFRRDSDWLAWNARYAEKRAGCVVTQENTGYQCRTISLLDRLHREHRLAWMWMTDEPLPEQIDHENRDGTDNRWCNLRASTHQANGRNRSMSRTNTSGVTGVHWHKPSGKWRAQCKINGKKQHLGLFIDIEEAARVVAEFRADNGFDPSHGAEIARYHKGGV